MGEGKRRFRWLSFGSYALKGTRRLKALSTKEQRAEIVRVAKDPEALLLVKPQFEVGRERVGKRGVVRDAQSHLDVLKAIVHFSKLQGWKTKGVIPSPITGPAGNHEYLLWLGISGMEKSLNLQELVTNTLRLKC